MVYQRTRCSALTRTTYYQIVVENAYVSFGDLAGTEFRVRYLLAVHARCEMLKKLHTLVRDALHFGNILSHTIRSRTKEVRFCGKRKMMLHGGSESEGSFSRVRSVAADPQASCSESGWRKRFWMSILSAGHPSSQPSINADWSLAWFYCSCKHYNRWTLSPSCSVPVGRHTPWPFLTQLRSMGEEWQHWCG